MKTCKYPGCKNKPYRGELCAFHSLQDYYRRQLVSKLSQKNKTPQDATKAYANALNLLDSGRKNKD